MKTYIIKKLSETDKSQLFDFYRKVYSNISKSFITNLKWYYRIGYNNFEPIVIIVENKIIGHAGLIPGDIESQNKIYPIIWFTDFIILPEYRTKGYGKILTEEWMKICPHQITFCNNLSLKVFKKLKWKSNLLTSRNIYPINYFNLAPVIKNFGLNIGNNLIRYFLKKKLNNQKLINPIKISETLIQDIVNSKENSENTTPNIVRDIGWFRWRLIETPYKNNIYFFENNGEFIIGHVFYQDNLKRLNILYTNILDSNKDIFEKVIKWSIENQVDFIWHVTTGLKNSNSFFSMFFQKKLNFAFNTSNTVLAVSLEKGFNNVQGIDSDIDYILRDR